MNKIRDHLIQCCEVILLKFKREIVREIRCIRLNLLIICSVGMLVLGMLTGAFGSGAVVYGCLCLPHFALSASGFILIWSIWYLLIGAAIGLLLGAAHCARSPDIRSALFWMSLLVLSNLIWYPTFFGLGSFVLSFLVLVIHLLIVFVSIGTLSKIAYLPSIIISAYFLWLIYCLFVNFCVILLN